MTQPQAELFDLYRTGLKTAADLMKTSLESAERLQNQQLVAIRHALDQQAKSVSELARARTLDELVTLQSRMAGAQFERALTLWSDLWQAAGEEAAKFAAAATNSAAARQATKQEQRRSA